MPKKPNKNIIGSIIPEPKKEKKPKRKTQKKYNDGFKIDNKPIRKQYLNSTVSGGLKPFEEYKKKDPTMYFKEVKRNHYTREKGYSKNTSIDYKVMKNKLGQVMYNKDGTPKIQNQYGKKKQNDKNMVNIANQIKRNIRSMNLSKADQDTLISKIQPTLDKLKNPKVSLNAKMIAISRLQNAPIAIGEKTTTIIPEDMMRIYGKYNTENSKYQKNKDKMWFVFWNEMTPKEKSVAKIQVTSAYADAAAGLQSIGVVGPDFKTELGKMLSDYGFNGIEDFVNDFDTYTDRTARFLDAFSSKYGAPFADMNDLDKMEAIRLTHDTLLSFQTIHDAWAKCVQNGEDFADKGLMYAHEIAYNKGELANKN